jgi:hypothetical protein
MYQIEQMVLINSSTELRVAEKETKTCKRKKQILFIEAQMSKAPVIEFAQYS